MVQRIVEYAVHVATIHGNGNDATENGFHSSMLSVAKEFALKCGSILQIDTGLHDKLVEEARDQGNLLKREVCEVLMLANSDSEPHVQEVKIENQLLDTMTLPFKVSQLKVKEASVHERLCSLLEPPAPEKLALCLKSVRSIFL